MAEIPKTSVGKFRKTALREQFAAATPVETRRDEHVRLHERRDAVALVTIDNPPMNALAGRSPRRARGGDRRTRRRTGRRVIVLRGARRAGVRRRRGHQGVPGAPRVGLRGRLGARDPAPSAHRMDAAATPFVAAIRGFCLGGGPRARDVLRHPRLRRRRDARAARDQARASSRAAVAPSGCRALVGQGRAMFLNLTGDFVDAEHRVPVGPRRACRSGRRARGRGRRDRRQDRRAVSPRGLGAPRARSATTRDLPLEEGLRREADGFVRCLRSDDGAEGVAAFIEKRAPVFAGR